MIRTNWKDNFKNFEEGVLKQYPYIWLKMAKNQGVDVSCNFSSNLKQFSLHLLDSLAAGEWYHHLAKLFFFHMIYDLLYYHNRCSSNSSLHVSGQM